MKRIGLLAVVLLIFWVGMAFGGTRGLAIKTTGGEKVGGYSGSYALLIGVSRYEAWPRLNSVPSEVGRVETLLKKRGFTVVKVMDPDGGHLQSAFESFIDKYGYTPDNRLLFYFAGHGFTRNNGAKGYLVPVDAPSPNKDEQGFLRKALPMNQVLAWSRDMEAKHALFLFDSCFSGTIFKTRALPNTPPHISRATSQPVRQYITAGDAGEAVPAKSVFTPVFIDALEYGYGDLNKDGYISGTELGLHLQSKVPQYTAQNPQYGKIKDYDLARGDFIFMGTMVADGSTYGAPVGQSPKKGSLRIESEPSGAEVFVDGKHVGRTPKTLDGLNPGRVTVRVEKSGYQPMEEPGHVMAGDSRLVAFPLSKAGADVKAGRLYVLATPDGATVRILNISPRYSEGMSLAPGKYHVEVSKSGYGTVRQWVDLKAGQDLKIPVTLQEGASGSTGKEKTAKARIAQLDKAIRDMESRLTSGKTRKDDSLPAMTELIGQKEAEEKNLTALIAARKQVEQKRAAAREQARRDEFMKDVAAYETIIGSKYGKTMGPGAWKSLVAKYPAVAKDVATGDTGGLKKKFDEATGRTWRDPTTGMEFVFVPGGCYRMGSNSGQHDEKPVHEVCVDGFWMGKFEVTQAEWQRVMGSNPSGFKGDRNPVEQVSWNDAQEFIKRLNAKGNGTFRLPTEAEWEYAARSGGKDEKYAGGNDVNRVAWYGGNSGNKTHPVGTKAPNGLGLYDMSGNVWEWCQDWYNDKAYSQHSRQNPIYSGGGGSRVDRGGSWFFNARLVRAADRDGGDPGGRSRDLGFRLLRTN